MEGSQQNSEKEEGELSSDDECQIKFSELQSYIPFLMQVIQRLEQSNDKSREAQLSKMKSLYTFLTGPRPKKLKVGTLKRCDDVLRNLVNKVEKTATHKDGGKVKKKSFRESSHTSKNAVVSDSSNSSLSEHIVSHSKHIKESDDLRVGEKMSDHDAVVSSTTPTGDSDTPVTDVVKALKLAAARNNLRSKLENVKTAMHSPNHSDDVKGNVSSSSPSHLVSSSSPTKQHLQERSDCNAKDVLEQSRERLKKLMGHHLTATPSPPYHSPNDAHSRSFERNTLDMDSPKGEWLYSKDSSWEQYPGAPSISSDSCDGELFTRRDVWNTEKNRTQSASYNTYQDDGLKTESNQRPYDKLSPKSEALHKSPKSMKLRLSSSPPSHSKMFSPERSEESDKSDGGSGPRRLRAKLEQEIHKVHRVGVSTGGALRSLVTKEDRNKPFNKGKSDDEKSPRSTKSSENFEKPSLEIDKKGRERSHKSDEKCVDPRRRNSVDRSPSPLKNSFSGVKNCIDNSRIDNSHSKSNLSNKLRKSDGVDKNEKEGPKIISSMSREELQRIVSENLHDLPSPPPIPKEILETVTISPKPNSNLASNPSWKSSIQSSKLPSTQTSPDVFHISGYSRQNAYNEPSQELGKGRKETLEQQKLKGETHQVLEDLRINAHCNVEKTVRNVYISQGDERQNVNRHEFDSRSALTSPQNLENVRITGPPRMAEDMRTVTQNHLQETSREGSSDTMVYQIPILESRRHRPSVDKPRALYRRGIDDPRTLLHNNVDPRQVQHSVEDPRQVHHVDPRQVQNSVEDPRIVQNSVEDPRQVHHHVDPRLVHHHVEDPQQVYHHVVEDPQQVYHHVVENPQQVYNHVVEDSQQVYHHVVEDSRQVHHHGVEDSRQVHHHGVEDSQQVRHHVEDPRQVRHHVEDPRQVHHVEDPRQVHHHVEDTQQVHHHAVEDPRQVRHHGVEDSRQVRHHVEDPRQVRHHVEDPRQVHHHVEDPRQVHHHGVEDPRQVHHQGEEDPRQVYPHDLENPRQMLHHSVDDPRQVPHHGVDDPRQVLHHGIEERVNMSHSFRDQHRNLEETRVVGERRRGLLPTPPKHNYLGPTASSRRHVQDISTRFEQSTHLNEKRNNSLVSPELQNWDASHWGNSAAYSQTPNVERYPPQMFQTRDSRGQINMAANEQFSPTGHTSNYQWGTNDANLQQSTMHNNFLAGYKVQTRVDHTLDHSQSKSRAQHADPRLHKGEHPEAPPDNRTGDPRLSRSDSRHSTQYYGSRQSLVTGISRIASVSERDPRRRSVDEVDNSKKSVQDLDDNKKKRQSDSWRSSYRSSRSENYKKNEIDRDRKRSGNAELLRNKDDDVKNSPKNDSPAISSPLDFLYGTTAVAKTGKGYGFQNFRIPKIKRPRPPTPPRPAPPKEKIEVKCEVKEEVEEQQTKENKEETSIDIKKENESEPKICDIQTKEVTQEFIESLIRKSFESGEGKKLFEHAMFFENLSESLKNKKFRKIRRILESDSEDSDSDNVGKVESKEEKVTKKEVSEKVAKPKEPVVDSEDEPLSEKLESKTKTVSPNSKIVSDSNKSEIVNTSNENLEISKDSENTSQVLNKNLGNVAETSKPVKKPAAKRRNALELLQQDVRDMFIREGVVTATGYRMCRLLKEVQCGASLEEISKNEARRMEDEADKESDSSSTVGKNEKKVGSKTGTKKKVTSGPKTSKKLAKSSQDVLSDDETLFSSKKKTKRNRQLIDDSESDSSVSTASYRASKSKISGSRVPELDKDIVRRRRVPRIILEKADLSKFRSRPSKNHIESEEESSYCLFNEEETKKKVMLRRNNRKVKRSTERNLINDCVVNEAYFNTEPYIFKRKRLTKSILISGRKLSDIIPKLHKGEIPDVSLAELFLVENVSSLKVVSEVEIASNHKQNNASSVTNSTVTSTTLTLADRSDDEKRDSESLLKRLHKILPAANDEPCLEVENSDDVALEEEKSSSRISELTKDSESASKSHLDLSKDKILVTIEQEKTISRNIPFSSEHLTKSPIKLNLVKKKGTQRKKKACKWSLGIIKKKTSVNKSKSGSDFAGKKDLDIDILMNDCESVDHDNTITNENQDYQESLLETDASIDQFEIRPPSVESEKKKDSGRPRKEFTEKYQAESVNFVDLDYAYHFEAKQTACLLCSYEGRAIVQHYKQVHPDNEVLISRLPIDEACRATTESEDKGYNESSFKEDTLGNRRGPGSFFCRFCNYKAQYAVSFYEHTSSHTGEYRYQCCMCPYMSASRTTFKGHFYNHHPKNKLKQGLNLKVLTESPSNNAKFIFGYLCSKCNFVQLRFENMQKHISLRHSNDKEVKPIRINMSKSAAMETSDLSDGESYVENSGIISEDEVANDGDTEEDFKECTTTEETEKINHTPNRTEGKEYSSAKSKNKNEDIAQVSEKKPNVLEAFLPVSLEVDDDECIILEERVKRIQDIIVKVKLNSFVANLQVTPKEDNDIIVLFENKLQSIKQELNSGMSTDNNENLSNEVKSLHDESDSTNNQVKNVKKEQDLEKSDKKQNEGTEMLTLSSDGGETNTNDMESSIVHSSPVVESEKEKSSVDLCNMTSDSKTMPLLRRPSEVSVELIKPQSINNKNGDELGERRITRSLSRTDDDGKSVISDDSGCDTSNFEVIEITDESDIGEDDIDLESTISNAKCDFDEGVSLRTGNLIERLTKQIASKEKIFVPSKIIIEEQERKETQKISLQPPPLAASLNKPSNVAKKSSLVQVASLEAKFCPDKSIQFSCLVPSCIFTTTDALLMEKHLTRSHKPHWWDGICSMCNKRVFGDDFLKSSPMEHKYPLTFALDHLQTVHLNSMSGDILTRMENTTVAEHNSLASNSLNVSQLLIGADEDNLERPNQSESEENVPVVKAPQYIRMRRLSGDKLSAPVTSHIPVPSAMDTSSDSCSNLVSGIDSNILMNESGGDDELPFLKIENVRSLHPSASLNVSDTFIDENLSDSSVSSPVIETSTAPSQSTLMETCSTSDFSPELVPTLPQKLLSIPTSPVNKQIQLVSVSAASGGTLAVVSNPATSTNIPQPLVNLAQIIRPVTRVVVPKETASRPLQQKRIRSSIFLGGSGTLPNILPKPTSTYINIITSPVKSACPTSVVLSPTMVASSSQHATPSAVLSPTSTLSSPVITSVAVVPNLKQNGGAGSRISFLSRSDGSFNVSGSTGCARTSHFVYKRRNLNNPLVLKNTRQNLHHKSSKTFEVAKASKAPSVYQRMLIHDKLRQLFKCMTKHCTYTTDSPIYFEEHCWKHVNLHQKLKFVTTDTEEGNAENDDVYLQEMRKIETGGWPQCAYCCTIFDTPRALNYHVQEEHSQCLYQCAYCFFRAYTYSYVVLHQNTNHTDMRITVLLCRKIPDLLPPITVKFPRTEVILPYVCNQGNCGKTFWNPAAFWRHLENSHINMTCYNCHICEGQYVKTDKLLIHYKLHCHCLYQCLYCVHGSDTKEDMQHHLCNFHTNQKAVVVMRDSDPNMPAIGSEEEKSIDRLKVIDLDENLNKEGIIFPPVPSPDLCELTADFWKSYKAFADENPSIDICNDNLLNASSSETIMCVLPGKSNNLICDAESPIGSGQMVSENRDTNSRTSGTDIEMLNRTSDSVHSSDVNTMDNSPTNLSNREDPNNVSESSEDTDEEIVQLDSSCNLNKNTSSEKNEIKDCDVILIDDSMDEEEQTKSLENKKTNKNHTEMPEPSCNNEDSDSDVMIIGSDDDVIPSKKQKLDFNLTLQKSDPNYEPVVVLRHRNIETRARIESAVDPLALDPQEKNNPYMGSSSKAFENVTNHCPQNSQREQSLSENIILIPDDNDSSESRANVILQSTEITNNKDTHGKNKQKQLGEKEPPQQQKQQLSLLSQENLLAKKQSCEKQSQDKQQQNISDKMKVDSASISKDVGIDHDILAQSAITVEELEKTGVSGERLYRCGNSTCSYGAPTPTQLRDHLLICDLSRESLGLTCVHCQRPFKQITPYMEHLKHHGTCRYNCFMCKFRSPLPQQVIKHLKQKHRIYNSIVLPVNQQNTNPDTDLFVVCSKDKTRPKVVTHFRNKRIFNPDEVNFLPKKYISYHPLTCSVCHFRSKVVSNMRRHLNFHNNKSMERGEIPLSDPVNPVPHLEKKEMMFDKMTNLAASSHPLGRMGAKPPPNASSGGASEQIILPKFVPENERYVCGTPGCNYLTCDETMLRYHMRALHCDETSYRCPHCPESMQKDLNGLPIPVDRMGAHLKMHDGRMYKCTHCCYFHFQRHIVERHLADRHPEKRPFVQVVREEGEASSTFKPEAHNLGGSGDVLLNTSAWMCGLCKVQYATRTEVFEHASVVHNIKSHFKCGLCTFRSSSKPNCETHFYSRHPGIEFNIITICQKVDGDSVNYPSSSRNNTSTLELTPKRFDTTPLWLRNMVRIRHIRGVLLEDEEETRLHLQKIDENFVPKKVKIKECVQSLSETQPTPLPKDLDHLENKFAPYGKPVMGNFFFCTLCKKYKTRFKADMKDHLYRELNYVKWMCQHCDFTSCNKHQIVKHSRVHEKLSKPESIIALQVDKDIELWVDNLLSNQHYDMKGIPDVTPAKQIPTSNKVKLSPLSNSSASCGPSVPLLKSANSTPNSKLGMSQKTTDLPENSDVSDDDISLISMANGSHKRKLMSMAKRDLEDFEDNKSKKICEKGEQKESDHTSVSCEESTQKGKSPSKENATVPMPTTAPAPTVQTRNYKCKHCKATFTNVRGLKLHVRLKHLRLGSYSCGYCDIPAYSEMAIKIHCKSHHAGEPELIIHNRGASDIKLDEEFWEREYGIKPKGDEFAASKKYNKVSGQYSNLGAVKASSLGSSTAVSSSDVPQIMPLPAQFVASRSSSTPITFSDSYKSVLSSDLPSATFSEVTTSSKIMGAIKDDKEIEDADEIVLIDEITRKCAHCEYRSKSASDLRNHEMRHWVEKPFKCGHCEFEAVKEYELKKHSAKAHPNKQVRVIQKQLPSTPEIKPLQRGRKTQFNSGISSDAVGGNDNKELSSELSESPLESTSNKSEEDTSESRKMFRCFYCPLRATALAIVHKHWEKTHKGKIMSATGVSRNGLPFRYKEVDMNDLLRGETSRKKKATVYSCSYCNKKGTYSSISFHHEQCHPDTPMKIVGIITQYECAECQLITLSSVTLKRHFESEHPEKEFRYMVRSASLPVKVTGAESFLSPKEGSKESIVKDLNLSGHSDDQSSLSTSNETKQTASKEKSIKYVCGWCSETCSREKMNFHHAMFHSHLEHKFAVESSSGTVVESTSKRTVTHFKCPKCSFKVPSYEEICEHLRKHCRPFKCGYCTRSYELPNQVRNHLSVMHFGLPPKIISLRESTVDLSALKSQIVTVVEEVDSLQYTEVDSTRKGMSGEEPEVPCKKQARFGFARKSTSMKQRIFSVARKSTNPSPYSHNKRIEESLASSESGSSRSPSPTLQEEFSYYGQKVVPLDWKKIRTTVNYGGVYVQVDVESMAQIFNLNPIVLVKDLKTQWKV